MEIYQILLIFAAVHLLIFLGRRFPDKIGKYTHFWVGPKPKEGLSSKRYFLSWARITSMYLCAAITAFALLIYFLSRSNFSLDRHPVIAAILCFAGPILIAMGIVRLIEFLIKSYVYRDGTITFEEEDHKHYGKIVEADYGKSGKTRGTS
jgi:hypothetical protein